MIKYYLKIIVFLGLATSMFSQIPNGFSYQAILRDSDQSLLREKEVNVAVSILRNEEIIFSQNIIAATNENGILSIIIGDSSEFLQIDWSEGPLFVKTMIDPNGGNNFTIETITQLLSVPYSMVAKTAINVPELDLLKGRITNLEKQVKELKDIVMPPCNCIMDTLKGEWSWTRRMGGFFGEISDNEYISIIRILNQNEDASINYEVYVEDELYHSGNFQIQYHPIHPLIIFTENLKLPHFDWWDWDWQIYFGHWSAGYMEGTLTFWDGTWCGYYYYYKKVE